MQGKSLSEPGQLAGRLVRPEDITPALKGRSAQMFWPEDKLWYPVEIQAINIRTKQAKILYMSGEVEDLDLDDIIKEGHMALL